MRLYFILAFICKTVMVWPGVNNQMDYNTVPDIQKYYLDGSNIHIVLIIPLWVYYKVYYSIVNINKKSIFR